MAHKWCNHLPLCLNTSKLLLTFMSYCVLFCVLYRKESANKRYRTTVNNLISPNSVSQNDDKTHSAKRDDTAIPNVKIKIKITEYRVKKAQYGNTVNPHVPLLWQVKTYLLLLIQDSDDDLLYPQFCRYSLICSWICVYYCQSIKLCLQSLKIVV